MVQIFNSMRRFYFGLIFLAVAGTLVACTPTTIPTPTDQEQEEQQKPEDEQGGEQGGEEGGEEEVPPTPEVVPGVALTVTLSGNEKQLMANAGDKHDCEISFTLSPSVDEVKTEVVTTGFTNVTTEVVFDEGSYTSGKVKISSTDTKVSYASVILKATQSGQYISDNWCSSNKINLEFATLELSTYTREFSSGGNPGARVAVRTNTGVYDCEVPTEYQGWITILDKNKDNKNNILFTVGANESYDPREGYFMVYDKDRQQSAKYIVTQIGIPQGHIHDWDEDADEEIDF